MLGQTFIVVWEGVDGAGKTTLMNETSKILANHGYSVIHYKTPSDTPTGRAAKTIGNSGDVDPLTRMLLFLANTSDDSKIMRRQIEALSPSFYFIDRYYLCSIIYGLALLEKTIKKSLIQNLEKLMNITQELGEGIFIKPDYYVIVVLDDEESRIKRVMSKDESGERRFELDTELQRIVRRYYERFAREMERNALVVDNRDNTLSENAGKVAQHLIATRDEFLRGRGDG